MQVQNFFVNGSSNPTTILYGTTMRVSFTVTRESADTFPGGLAVFIHDAESNDVPIYFNSKFKLDKNKSANIGFEIVLENEDLSMYLDAHRALAIDKFIVVFGKSVEPSNSQVAIPYAGNFVKTKGFSIDSVLFRRAKQNEDDNEVIPDDEGTFVLSNLKISASGISDISDISTDSDDPESLKLICYYSDGQVSTSSDYFVWTEYIGDAMSDGGIVNSSELVYGEFDTTKNWHFMIEFGDDYERAVVYSDLPDAFANVHLSGCGKGVAFGKFSASTLEHPLFECRYPARIDGINVFDSEAGEIETGGTMDDSPIYRRMIVHEHIAQGNSVAAQINGVKNVVSISGIAEVTLTEPIDDSYSFSFPIGFYDGTSFFMILFNKTKSQLIAMANVACTFYVTIDYTKQ